MVLNSIWLKHNYRYCSFFLIIDHGIHPPIHKPWEAPVVPDTDHIFVNNNGVYEIYKNQTDLDNKKSCNYIYPDVEKFTTDFYNMCNLIADGPL